MPTASEAIASSGLSAIAQALTCQFAQNPLSCDSLTVINCDLMGKRSLKFYYLVLRDSEALLQAVRNISSLQYQRSQFEGFLRIELTFSV
ncbi:hypothetical protein H6G54_25195 [Anabaena cylindrica FACHB-243]|uniref:Uncharacterized protein n=1 Tax=Anabaena cylindrica (strain ATCC 27899 / PCC 7122) TaxID=272123 RepID=K9ZFZ7_ANACC|nr:MULTISPECIES: hypothetical protein [Anabaena]AFZ57265.1 hypothetical protein Anacy_1773 [Anabaena cylindrica PCC 7122]MBD2420934.1 hypothetical protein [Anabaena cylindrica FACHB-243]MBY5283466.1 hypothetical protein [Anabaena sp. CCAP 1446/1C]MBY5307009.1 hypothetical protein [Anabaena sp. CCAP 1446/1C]MCM2405688.1 hypothetical protein [Anabaena sp. CCAP 1446/1C]